MSILTAIRTDIGHAERVLDDYQTNDGEWFDNTDPVLCEGIDDLCGTLRDAASEIERLEQERDQLRARDKVAGVLIDHLTKSRATARAVARMLLASECPMCGGGLRIEWAYDGVLTVLCEDYINPCGYTRTREQLLAEIGGDR